MRCRGIHSVYTRCGIIMRHQWYITFCSRVAGLCTPGPFPSCVHVCQDGRRCAAGAETLRSSEAAAALGDSDLHLCPPVIPGPTVAYTLHSCTGGDGRPVKDTYRKNRVLSFDKLSTLGNGLSKSLQDDLTVGTAPGLVQ
jgi:hypothetical protein